MTVGGSLLAVASFPLFAELMDARTEETPFLAPVSSANTTGKRPLLAGNFPFRYSLTIRFVGSVYIREDFESFQVKKNLISLYFQFKPFQLFSNCKWRLSHSNLLYREYGITKYFHCT